jgi:hypothetical protein
MELGVLREEIMKRSGIIGDDEETARVLALGERRRIVLRRPSSVTNITSG